MLTKPATMPNSVRYRDTAGPFCMVESVISSILIVCLLSIVASTVMSSNMERHDYSQLLRETGAKAQQ